MNVYDFDGTIYKGDSTFDFYKYVIKHRPYVLRYVFIQSWFFFMYVLGFYSKTLMKERFHVYLKGLNDVEALVEEFWNEHICEINQWYIDQKHSSDVIITASPDFIVRSACKRIDIENVIATIVNPANGHFQSENNQKQEKVKRFRQIYKTAKVEEFYSDSLSDEPMTHIATHSFFVTRSYDIIPWEEYKPSLIKRMKSTFFQR